MKSNFGARSCVILVHHLSQKISGIIFDIKKHGELWHHSLESLSRGNSVAGSSANKAQIVLKNIEHAIWPTNNVGTIEITKVSNTVFHVVLNRLKEGRFARACDDLIDNDPWNNLV